MPSTYTLCVLQIYGKTLRREAIAKLRENATGNRGRTPLVEPQQCCALRDVIVNQAAKIHEQLEGGSLQALRSKIAADNQNAAMVRLDVENVRAGLTSLMGEHISHLTQDVKTSYNSSNQYPCIIGYYTGMAVRCTLYNSLGLFSYEQAPTACSMLDAMCPAQYLVPN